MWILKKSVPTGAERYNGNLLSFSYLKTPIIKYYVIFMGVIIDSKRSTIQIFSVLGNFQNFVWRW